MLRGCQAYYDEMKACTSYRGRLVGSFVGLCNSGCGRFHQYYVAGETADCSNWEKNYSDCELWVDRWGLDAAMDSPSDYPGQIKKLLSG